MINTNIAIPDVAMFMKVTVRVCLGRDRFALHSSLT